MTAIPQELLNRALYDPTLQHALTMVQFGEWTLEHAMVQAALNLSAAYEASQKRLVRVLETCSCGAATKVIREAP